MELCGDDEYDLKKHFNYMKTGESEVSLQSYGDVLHHLGKYDPAEKIFYRLFVQLPSNDPSLYNLMEY